MVWKPDLWLAPPIAPIRYCSQWGLHMPRPLLRARWALTPPFHPYPCFLQNSGGLFSVALSLRYGLTSRPPRPDVIRHCGSMEPGLSSTATFRFLQQQSPGRLAKNVYGRKPRRSSPDICRCTGWGFRSCMAFVATACCATKKIKRLLAALPLVTRQIDSWHFNPVYKSLA